ncbi:DUF4268 domain-containing protein [Litoribacter populi]|uniref:DUF4268 domain-containing protein n=1 Tax=Litoribacter populi TaxID=2598460 RepID=UPI00117C57AC|nr:DUF4268 domain-containing protein [Litoribacter populi]
MYKKAEIAKTKKEFWTAFGAYMKPVPSAEGTRVNWQNYKTGVKQLFFRMKAERGFASIGIELNHPDLDIQELQYEQLLMFKKMLHSMLGEEWEWSYAQPDEYGRPVSKAEAVLNGVSVMEKNDWPKIISFLKPRVIVLDEFWSNVRHGFEELK